MHHNYLSRIARTLNDLPLRHAWRHISDNLGALVAAAVGGHVGIAGAGVVVPRGPRRDAVAALAARPARPLTQVRPRRQPASLGTSLVAV